MTSAATPEHHRGVHLDAVIEVCSDAIIGIDAHARVLSWNRAAERILGRGTSLAAGAPAHDLFADHELFSALLRRAADGEGLDGVAIEVIRPPGRNLAVMLSLIPNTDGPASSASPASHVTAWGPRAATVVLRDLSEQVFAQQTLAESELRVHRAEALAVTGTFVVDAHDRSEQWSEGMYRIHGADPGQFGVSLASHLDLVFDEDRAKVAAAFENALAGGNPAGVDHRVQRRDGGRSWVFLAVEPRRDSHGIVLGMSGVCQDITARKASEAALHDALEREHSAGDELRRIDALKDEFLATVSHELRTPLTSIAGFAALLSEAAPEHRGLVEPIERNAIEMHQLVAHLLDQARLESGRVILEPRPLPLLEAVRDVLSQLAPVLSEMHVAVDIAESIVVMMDPDGFVRVMSNLLGNAAKYAPRGTITIGAHEVDGTVTVSIADDGPGIALEHQRDLFDQFFRVPGASGSGRSAGYGLFIVRRYVELHGGSVWCQSAAGSGTTFLFTVSSGGMST